MALRLWGEEVVITAVVENIKGRELICSIEARVNERLVATEDGTKNA